MKKIILLIIFFLPSANTFSQSFKDITTAGLDFFLKSDKSKNYPNPFNPSTTIKYYVPELSKVNLKVYNILGEEVRNLINEEQAAGTYNVQFSTNNYQLASGIYFYKLEARSKVSGKHFTKVGKMVFLK